MFLGHFGLAYATKRWKNEHTVGSRVSLAVLFLAAQWADLLWPILLLAGIEKVAIQPGITAANPLNFTYYPWSHSLLMDLIWGLVIGGIYYGWTRQLQAAVLVGALVPSHWVLDLIVHRPDLPLWPGGPTVGLGLWSSVSGTFIVELGLMGVGMAIYLMTTASRDRIGTWGTYVLGGLLVVIYLGMSLGPPPADPTAVAYSALALWITIPLAYWIDKHREPRQRSSEADVPSPSPGASEYTYHRYLLDRQNIGPRAFTT